MTRTWSIKPMFTHEGGQTYQVYLNDKLVLISDSQKFASDYVRERLELELGDEP